MGIFKRLVILFLLILGYHLSVAQKTPSNADSSNVYNQIESYSKKNKLTSFFYQLLFKPLANNSETYGVDPKVYKKLKRRTFKNFEGKIIRNIKIVTLDPFGFSAEDTSSIVQNALYNAGNSLHLKTRHITIRNLLLVRQNQLFDSLLVKESERLVRSQRYIHDVSFLIELTSKRSDSVDILIRVLDNWSIIPEFGISSSNLSIGLTDKNIFGLGHEFQNEYSWNHTNGSNSYITNYFIPNIRNSYINAILHYGIDEYKNYNKSIGVERPFFSPLAKWAAGILIAQQFKADSINYQGFGYRPFNHKLNSQDFWVGKSTQVFKGFSEDLRTTNLILAARYLRKRYAIKPEEIYDSTHFYSNEDFYIASIGISTRKYVQDKFIFNYGIVEDVPVGMAYGLTAGYQLKNNLTRYYIGLRYSVGNYYDWGYFSGTIEYGTFLHSSRIEQGVFLAGLNYYTGLFKIGNWKLRQFVKPQITMGIKRFTSDSLTLKDANGLVGFNSTSLRGTNRLLFTFQTQLYAPWNLIGFRFGPFINYSIGLLGDEIDQFKNSRVYSQIGLGVLIKNENLVINTFQLSISFYPVIPGNGTDIFKLNSFQTTDFGFRDFEIGKPAIVPYR